MASRAVNSIDTYIGSRVRLRRNELGMSQEALGRGLNLTFQQVQKYEKGTNRIGGSRMAQISILLNVPPSYFFDGAPGLNGASIQVDRFALAISQRDVQRLLAAYLKLPPKTQAAFVNLLTIAVAEETDA